MTRPGNQPQKLAALKQAWQEWNNSPDVLIRLARRLATTLSPTVSWSWSPNMDPEDGADDTITEGLVIIFLLFHAIHNHIGNF